MQRYIVHPETAVSIKSLFIVVPALVASTAFAQTSLGTVGNVQGLVTDTDGASVTSTGPGEAIRDGQRFVTSSSGSVTLQLNNGCTLTLQPNQAVTIDSSMTCRQLTASITPVAAPTLAAAGGAGGSAAMGALGIAGLTLAGFGLHRGLDKNPSLSGQ